MVGSAVGPYQILGKLGAGGMGEVFLGHDPRLERRVALKCLMAAETQSGEVRTRVLREARAAARLNHPHIAAVYDVLEQDDRTFIVMEYVEGISLAAHLAAGPLPISEVRAIGRQLASALAAAHAQGVIHRDLKPANIQVTRDGSIKVLDFGVARLAPAISATADTTAGHPPNEITLPGSPGTPVYMSPEQLLSRPLDERSDIYSAGVIMFLMATGRRPYLETNAAALGVAMASGPPPAARSLNTLVPPDLSEIIAKSLELEPGKRFSSARALELALGGTENATRPVAAHASADATTRRVSAPAVPRRTWTIAVAIAVLLAVGVVARRPLMTGLGLARPAPVAAGPIVMAVLPVDNPSGDLQADYLGAGIASVVVGNLGSIPGLTVLSRASTAPYETRRNDLAAMHREIGADYVLDLAMKSAAPRAELVARLRKPGVATPVWEQTIGGDPLTVEQTLLDALARVLERQALSRRLNAAEYARVHKVPTKSGEALLAYSEARALLGPSSSPGGTARAVSLLQDAIAKDPSFALAYAALGDAYWETYQRERNPELVGMATSAVAEALRIDPNQAPVHYSLGNMYQQTGRYEEAIRALRRAIDLQPDSDDSHRLLGRVLATKGEYAPASAEAQRAIDIRPDWNNYYNQGLVEYSAGHLDNALVAFRRTTELNPSFAGGFQALGATFHMRGDLPNAIGNYEHSVRLAPNAPAYSNLALAYYKAKRYPEAIAQFSEAIARDPQQPQYYRNLADAYKAAGRLADARSTYEKTLTLARKDLTVNPRDVRAIVLVALCEANLGRRGEAERHAAEAAALAPMNGEVHFRVAKVYVTLGERVAAFAALRAAVAAGYEPNAAREDDELVVLRGREFDEALAAGVSLRHPTAPQRQ